MTARRYLTPLAFKQALEQRLQKDSSSGTDFARRRQLLIFERFLARITRVFGDSATLKGGLALELRLERARTTKDVDLRLVGPLNEVLARLQKAGQLDLGDFLSFEVRPNADHPEIQSEAMKYEGFRFHTECKLAGKRYGQIFGVDVAFGDPILGEPDVVIPDNLLDFIGIEPPTLRLYPVETHIAEKLHAYTMPRTQMNMRMKDLPDLALLATIGGLDAGRVRAALEQTFSFRQTHALPNLLPTPPNEWTQSYARMAEENELQWQTLSAATEAVRSFLEPVLAGGLRATWEPLDWKWKPQ